MFVPFVSASIRVLREAGGGEDGGGGERKQYCDAGHGLGHGHSHGHLHEGGGGGGGHACEGVHGEEDVGGVGGVNTLVGGVNTIVLRTGRALVLSRFNQYVVDLLQENGPKVSLAS